MVRPPYQNQAADTASQPSKRSGIGGKAAMDKPLRAAWMVWASVWMPVQPRSLAGIKQAGQAGIGPRAGGAARAVAEALGNHMMARQCAHALLQGVLVLLAKPLECIDPGGMRRQRLLLCLVLARLVEDAGQAPIATMCSLLSSRRICSSVPGTIIERCRIPGTRSPELQPSRR